MSAKAQGASFNQFLVVITLIGHLPTQYSYFVSYPRLRYHLGL